MCEECRAEAEGRAWGWLALRSDDEHDPAPAISFYCPRCARYEFGDYLRYRLFGDGESPLR